MKKRQLGLLKVNRRRNAEQLRRKKNQRKTRFNFFFFFKHLNLQRVWSSTEFEFCIFNGSIMHMERSIMLVTLQLMFVNAVTFNHVEW